jgi:hypothetical protein
MKSKLATRSFVGNSPENIAILFFSRSAPAEAKHKKFVSDSPKNSRVAHALITHSYQQAKQSGYPVFHIDEQQQRGTTFGERFSHAFQQIFDRGYDYVISVGNDIPQMETHHIKSAAQQLSSGHADLVLGPDTDGGTWLMGYSRNGFSANRFRKLPWNTDRLLDTILEQRGDISIYQLELLTDIDNSQAFYQLFRKHSLIPSVIALIIRLRSILAGFAFHLIAISLLVQQFLGYRANLMRAPPLR